jgi:hypothetical protein
MFLVLLEERYQNGLMPDRKVDLAQVHNLKHSLVNNNLELIYINRNMSILSMSLSLFWAIRSSSHEGYRASLISPLRRNRFCNYLGYPQIKAALSSAKRVRIGNKHLQAPRIPRGKDTMPKCILLASEGKAKVLQW